MKHKLLIIFILVSMVMGSFGTVLAQEKLPPGDSDDPASLPKEEVLNPLTGNSSLENGGFAGSEVSALATPTIINGGFEAGNVGFNGWGEYSTNLNSLILHSSSLNVPPHGGNWAVWLGGDFNEGSQIVQFDVSIANPTYLRLWYWIASIDDCGFDYGYVQLNGVSIHNWNLCEATNTNGWVDLNLNLNAYSGQTVNLQIGAYADEALNSNLFIDDVSLYRTFADVSYDYWAQNFIQQLYDASITGGCLTTPPSYCPENSVTRAQMAVFLEKGVHYPSAYSPPNVAPTFNDTAGHWAEDWIEVLRNDGITGGCGTNLYCPEDPVTRAQMAVFLLKSKYGSTYTPPAVGASTGFNDVPTAHWAAPWIKQLATEGITGGCGTGIYCPESAVTRAQMAVFLVRTFNLP